MNDIDTARVKNLVVGLKHAAEHLAEIHGELTSALAVAAALLARIDAVLNGKGNEL